MLHLIVPLINTILQMHVKGYPVMLKVWNEIDTVPSPHFTSLELRFWYHSGVCSCFSHYRSGISSSNMFHLDQNRCASLLLLCSNKQKTAIFLIVVVTTCEVHILFQDIMPIVSKPVESVFTQILILFGQWVSI